MDAPKSRYKGQRQAAKRERMMAAYLVVPGSWLERRKHRRAESWLVNDAMGPMASSLHDTRKQEAEMRERWRQWRAEQLGV